MEWWLAVKGGQTLYTTAFRKIILEIGPPDLFSNHLFSQWEMSYNAVRAVIIICFDLHSTCVRMKPLTPKLRPELGKKEVKKG
jgi:hypothetical protein